MVGNSDSDVLAGKAAGCRTILIAKNEDVRHEASPDFTVRSILEAADIILQGNTSTPPSAEPSNRQDDHIQLPSQPHTDSPAETNTGHESNMLSVLKDIRLLLQQQKRNNTQEDFSLARLGATLFQIMAAAVLLWGITGLLSADQQTQAIDTLTATARFSLAAVFQLLALTLFLTHRSK